MKITEKNFDVETGKETIIEREMTAAEVAEWEANRAEIAARLEAEAAKAAERAAAEAKLAALGLTADDLKALGL